MVQVNSVNDRWLTTVLLLALGAVVLAAFILGEQKVVQEGRRLGYIKQVNTPRGWAWVLPPRIATKAPLPVEVLDA